MGEIAYIPIITNEVYITSWIVYDVLHVTVSCEFKLSQGAGQVLLLWMSSADVVIRKSRRPVRIMRFHVE